MIERRTEAAMPVQLSHRAEDTCWLTSLSATLKSCSLSCRHSPEMPGQFVPPSSSHPERMELVDKCLLEASFHISPRPSGLSRCWQWKSLITHPSGIPPTAHHTAPSPSTSTPCFLGSP